MKANRKFTRDEDAVSPVIGVILMVAITVILAAVIAAFVFGMGSSLSKQYVVACTVSQISSEQIDVTYAGGPDADAVNFINVTITANGGNTFYTSLGNATSTNSPTVGSTASIKIPTPAYATGLTTYSTIETTTTNTTEFAQRDHVVITATFLDGTKQVILDTYL
jgi:flagellin-like protein